MLAKDELKNKILQLGKFELNVITDNEPLISSGKLDSLNLLDLVSFIEAKTKIKFTPLDFNTELFDSVEKILKLVKVKTNSSIEKYEK